MPEYGESTVVGRMQLASTQELVVSTATRDGKPCVDMRRFYADMDKVDDITAFAKDRPLEAFKPTKKGLFMQDAQFIEMMEKILVPLYEKKQKEGKK